MFISKIFINWWLYLLVLLNGCNKLKNCNTRKRFNIYFLRKKYWLEIGIKVLLHDFVGYIVEYNHVKKIISNIIGLTFLDGIVLKI